MTTRAWRWLLGGLLGLNLASAIGGKDTICCTLRELFRLDRREGRAALVVALAWLAPHLLNPAKRPGPR